MEFRSPAASAKTNADAREYLTQNLSNPEAGQAQFDELLTKLGNAVDMLPDWHPILTRPKQNSNPYSTNQAHSINELEAYKGIDHTILFVKGFITCPYCEDTADQLVASVNAIEGLEACRLDAPLYHDNAYPVVVQAPDITLEADGTIRSRDALRWFLQELAEEAEDAQVAETWWNIRSVILGKPHGSRSSLFVNQYTGGHMRKILETLNDSGMFGPIKEDSLEMFSVKQRKAIAENLISAAINQWDNKKETFIFELRGETCKANIRDTFNDGDELSIRVSIGDFDLCANGFYYPRKKLLQTTDPNGKKALAKKFT